MDRTAIKNCGQANDGVVWGGQLLHGPLSTYLGKLLLMVRSMGTETVSVHVRVD